MNRYVLSAAGLYGSAGRAKKSLGAGGEKSQEYILFPECSLPTVLI